MLNKAVLRAVVALCALLPAVLGLTAQRAEAQDFLSFLWSGGSREVISFHPSIAPGQIIVSFGDRKLYWVHARGEAISYPIAVPREKDRWQGVTIVSSKQVNPSWTPTPTMRRENPTLPAYLPGGHPMNPLGVRALYLGSSMYRIHGTDAPWTIGQAVSKGCIRMYNEDVLDLYPRVPVGTRVTVTWRRFS
jgi:lipoprotein-anchoring transpeptidase ErfK/SrfK